MAEIFPFSGVLFELELILWRGKFCETVFLANERLNNIIINLNPLSVSSFPDLRYHLYGHGLPRLFRSHPLLLIRSCDCLHCHPPVDLRVLAGHPGSAHHSHSLDFDGKLKLILFPDLLLNYLFSFLQELINTGLATALYFIAFIVQLAAWSSTNHWSRGSNITAGVFGLFNFLAYAFGSYFLYLEHKAAM